MYSKKDCHRFINTAETYLEEGCYGEAAWSFEEGAKCYKELGDLNSAAENFIKAAETYLKKERYKDAVYAFIKTTVIYSLQRGGTNV